MQKKIYYFILTMLFSIQGHDTCFAQWSDIEMSEDGVAYNAQGSKQQLIGVDKSNIKLICSWLKFLEQEENDWQTLVDKHAQEERHLTKCGSVMYMMPNLLERENEDFIIAVQGKDVKPYAHFHPRDFWEIYFVLEGTAQVTVGKTTYTVNPGDVVVIPGETAHYVQLTERLVLAVTTPPFGDDVTIKLDDSNKEIHEKVGFDYQEFKKIAQD